jgi:hypothetical protein
MIGVHEFWGFRLKAYAGCGTAFTAIALIAAMYARRRPVAAPEGVVYDIGRGLIWTATVFGGLLVFNASVGEPWTSWVAAMWIGILTSCWIAFRTIYPLPQGQLEKIENGMPLWKIRELQRVQARRLETEEALWTSTIRCAFGSRL